MIIGEIRRYLRDNNPIRVSRSLKDTAYKALQARDRLIGKESREPTIIDIAKELNISKEDVVMALDAIQEPISLFESVYHDGGDAIFVMDQVSDERNSGEMLESIAIMKLEPREREKKIWIFVSSREEPRWRLLKRSESLRLRSPVWKNRL